jgi:hypothetical protein
MLWWIITLLLFIGWAAGLNLIGMIVLCLVFVIIALGSMAGIDRRRRRHSKPYHFYHPPHQSHHFQS